MHLIAEESISIQQPVSAVYDYVTNMERFGDWFPGVIGISAADDLAHGSIGKVYRERVSIPLRGERKIKIVVRDARKNAFFATEGQFSPLMPRMEVVFSQRPAGLCHVTWKMVSRNRGLIFRLTLLPFIRQIMQKRARAGMQRLKEKLEGRSQAATGI